MLGQQIVGTDAPLIPHGKNAYEVVKMTERGMTPRQPTQSATMLAAELVNIDKIGQFKAGWHADIIAVDRNPLDDINAVKSVSFVMKAGRVYKGGE